MGRRQAGAGIVAAAVLGGALLAAPAGAQTRVEGQIRVASHYADVAAHYTACAYGASGVSGQGLAGWVLRTTPGKAYRLDGGRDDPSVDRVRPAGLALRFYTHAPRCDEPVRRGSDHSSGTVPAGATFAVVTAQVEQMLSLPPFTPWPYMWCAPLGFMQCTVSALPRSFAYTETDGPTPDPSPSPTPTPTPVPAASGASFTAEQNGDGHGTWTAIRVRP